jgi:hypothetical protein
VATNEQMKVLWFSRWWRKWKYRLIALILLVIIACAHGMVADHFVKSAEVVEKHGFESSFFDGKQFWIIVFSAVALSTFSFALFGLRNKLLSVSANVSRTDGHHPHASIILLLSDLAYHHPHAKVDPSRDIHMLKMFERVWARAAKQGTTRAYIAALEVMTHPYKNSKKKLLARAFNINWQQPLRAILWELTASEKSPHDLDEIVLICSRLSADNLASFQTLIKPLLEGWPERNAPISLKIVKQKLIEGEFELNYDLVKRTIEAAEHEHQNRRICVNVTGGTTDFSIAAAMATLNKKMSFGYVTSGRDNNGPPPTAFFFDAEISAPQFGEE